MSTTLADIPRLQAQCDAIRATHQAARSAAPFTRMWMNPPDSESSNGLIFRGIIADSVSARYGWRKNVPQQATFRLRVEHYLAQWVISIPNDPNAKKNCVITIDEMGGALRWSGILHHWQYTRDENNNHFVDITFVDDLQFLMFYLGPPNPLLPIDVFQFPRVLPIFGPSKWAISVMILMQLIRINGNIWTIPDDPFDVGSWSGLFDWSSWQVLIKCNPFDLDDSSLWTILATRMTRIDQVIADALEDAQLVLRYRRILTVDGETCPVDGVPVCRNGALVLEVVDQSGYWGPDGTATGGGIAGGFARTVQQFLSGFVEDTQVLSTDPEVLAPDAYYEPGYLGTMPGHPWVVVRDSIYTSMQTSHLTWSPATAVSVIVGGDNPMMDQLMELTIEAIGSAIGYFLLAGFSELGSIAETVIAPFLQGCIFAWIQWKNASRAIDLGWVHLEEVYQSGAENNAWSLSSVAALRSGFLSSKSETSHQFTMGAGGQYLPGLHFSIGDRIGSTVMYLGSTIFVDQVEIMERSWDWSAGQAPDWKVTVGNNKAAQSQAERSARLLDKGLETMKNLGVHLLS
ncbi:hypothetical protein ACFXG4_27115 [Nocardia sp. NPDC059246]|uniref:Gp37-like protein n=1 Tax=unclassified Nocardia TaxID=2637762 RepID=UPI0036CDAB0B